MRHVGHFSTAIVYNIMYGKLYLTEHITLYTLIYENYHDFLLNK